MEKGRKGRKKNEGEREHKLDGDGTEGEGERVEEKNKRRMIRKERKEVKNEIRELVGGVAVTGEKGRLL